MADFEGEVVASHDEESVVVDGAAPAATVVAWNPSTFVVPAPVDLIETVRPPRSVHLVCSRPLILL